MTQFGYKLMSEEHGPRALVTNAARAEAAGFDFVSISDHYHPWVEAQGHSPFAWSVLGAIAQVTKTIGITTGLTCPLIRYHPAIIAQAAATIAVMSDHRFTLALGAGERLNEHITGATWPSAPERHEMLSEAIDIIRLLWSGDVTSHIGAYYEIDHARLYDLPDTPVPIVVGVSGPHSVRLAAEKADGIMATEAKSELTEGFRSRIDHRAPCYTEVALAFAPTEKAGLELAQERFAFSALGWAVNSELPTPHAFEAATKFIRPDDLAQTIAAGPDVEKHVAAVKKYLDAGFDHIALVGIGPDQEAFIDFFEKTLHPALRELG
jgi:G6PDH family F420-dependent oxidoreductase